jgi:hypothetical protein
VQGGSVKHGIDPAHTLLHEVAIADRTHMSGVRAGQEIETGNLMIAALQTANEGLAQVAGTARD